VLSHRKCRVQVYSGYLTVPGPFKLSPYDSLEIHYQFHTSQNDPSKDPLVTWHQGGPGASSINLGLFTEMGYFNVDDQGQHANPSAWNRVANMLYLESPAGSGIQALSAKGSSACIKDGAVVGCQWDDVSQAEAYAHTLTAFRKAFPEFVSNDLYLTGESYFGQYGPNIAHYILNHAPFNKTLNLKGIAAGNACWGGDAQHVNCNGPNSEQNDIDMYWGKGLVSKKMYKQVYADCNDFKGPPNQTCERAVNQAYESIGPHNVYFLYDTCSLEHISSFLKQSGKSMRWLLKALRTELSTNGMVTPFHDELAHIQSNPASGARRALNAYPGADGGFVYGCGGGAAIHAYLARADVRKALHLKDQASTFGYRRGGPASITLWPSLAKRLRVLIYNGDADACVPYKGNEEWIDGLENQSVLATKEAWRPWFTGDASGTRAPAGYVTSYSVAGAPDKDFSFLTIRLAGHMVPTFQPKASLAFFERFLAAEPF
jgi:serine carboxypeptidase-like clade 1